MNKIKLKKLACFHAALIIDSALCEDWPFQLKDADTDTTIDRLTKEEIANLVQHMITIVQELHKRGESG